MSIKLPKEVMDAGQEALGKTRIYWWKVLDSASKRITTVQEALKTIVDKYLIPDSKHNPKRRVLLKTTVATSVFYIAKDLLDILPSQALATEVSSDELEEEIEKLVHESLALPIIDGIWFANFVDSIGEIADFPILRKLLGYLGEKLELDNLKLSDNKQYPLTDTVLNTTWKNTDKLVGWKNGKHSFPTERIWIAILLLAARSACGHEAMEEVIHEVETTWIWVSLLAFLTSFWKSYIEYEKEQYDLDYQKLHWDHKLMTDEEIEIFYNWLWEAVKTKWGLKEYLKSELKTENSIAQKVIRKFIKENLWNWTLEENSDILIKIHKKERDSILEERDVLEKETNLEKAQRMLWEVTFQLTFLPTLTQLPLTAFGNASLWWREYDKVKEAYELIFAQLPNETEELIQVISSPDFTTGNKKIDKNIKSFIWEVKHDENFKSNIIEKLTKDLMILLMSTACDDSQSALWDAGPIIWLMQSYWFLEALKVIPATLVYTFYTAFSRSLAASNRVWISYSNVFNAKNWEYWWHFISHTWLNLLNSLRNSSERFFWKNPKISRYQKWRDSMFPQQIFTDAQSMFDLLWEPIQSELCEKKFNEKRIFDAIKKIEEKLGDVDSLIGRMAQNENKYWNINDIKQEAETNILGPISNNPEIAELQKTLIEMAKKDKKAKESKKDEEFSQEYLQYKEITKFSQEIEKVTKQIQDELNTKVNSVDWKSWASLWIILELLQEKPNWKSLINFDYWHDKLWPEIADTVFAVTLQGFHLPFIIATIDRVVYKAEWFKNLPLKVREIISALLNDFISMFADNWADAVAHSKWLTGMYLEEIWLGIDSKFFKEFAENKAKDYAANKLLKETEKLNNDWKISKELEELKKDFFKDDHKLLIWERYERLENNFIALVDFLIKRNPEKKQEFEFSRDEILKKSDLFYRRSMLMTIISAVTGGWKSKLWNAPHFTFSKDIELIDTLQDLKKHPLYQVYDTLFSSFYSTSFWDILVVWKETPWNKVRKALQQNFIKAYPWFIKKLEKFWKADEIKHKKAA